MESESTSVMDIVPFNRPYAGGMEFRYIADAIEGMHLSGDGPFSKKCQALLEGVLGSSKILTTTSCTHALEMTAILLDIAPGDEVILPSFTFVSTVNAFILRGARPVFVDIHPDTLNLDETRLEGLITPRTRAVVPVHYGGVGCEMDAILTLAKAHEIAVVEDNAHGLFGQYRGRWLGTFGDMATLSFHETKNFTCGEGGALLINNPRYIERAEIIREKGTDRGKFFRGLVDKYTWTDVGSSYVLSDILAAYLYAQLEERETIQAKRKQIWETYRRRLAPWAEEHGVRLPFVPQHCLNSHHLFYLILPSESSRDNLIAHLKERGVSAVFHYLPLHLSPMGKRYGYQPGDCAVTEVVSARLVRLPFFNQLTEDQQERVCSAVEEFRGF